MAEAPSLIGPAGLFFDKRATAEGGRFFRDLQGRETAQFFKTATPDPTFLWDEPVADGFHRPAREQPEALEHGGERFHASDANYGTGTGLMHGAVDHAAERPAAAAHSALGKHAAALPRFGGTSFEKSALSWPTQKGLGQAYDKVKDVGGDALEQGKELGGKILDRAGRYGGQAVQTLKGSGEGLGESVDEALDSASRHPLGAAAMLGGAGILGAKAVGGAARGVARGVTSLVRRKPKVPTSLIERGLAGLSHLIRK